MVDGLCIKKKKQFKIKDFNLIVITIISEAHFLELLTMKRIKKHTVTVTRNKGEIKKLICPSSVTIGAMAFSPTQTRICSIVVRWRITVIWPSASNLNKLMNEKHQGDEHTDGMPLQYKGFGRVEQQRKIMDNHQAWQLHEQVGSPPLLSVSIRRIILFNKPNWMNWQKWLWVEVIQAFHTLLSFKSSTPKPRSSNACSKVRYNKWRNALPVYATSCTTFWLCQQTHEIALSCA